MHAGAGGLAADDAGFFVEHFTPAFGDGAFGHDLLGELDEGEVVAMLGRPEALVELGEFLVRAGFGEEFEAFAGAGLDKRGDHEAVDEFLGALAATDELVEVSGVGVGVGLGEPAAAAGEDAGDDGEVLDLVPSDGGHRGDPVFWWVGLGPAVEEFQGVGGGFFLEVCVVVKKGEGVFEDDGSPGGGGGVAEGQVGSVAHKSL